MAGDDQGTNAVVAADDRPLILHLWHLLKATRESADQSYAALTPFTGIARQTLLILDRSPALTFPELCGLIGKDKAQVSRGLGRLEAAGLVTRSRARGPFTLTDAGTALTAQLMAMAERRNDRLLAGLEPAVVADFHATTEALILQARALYEAERAVAGDPAPAGAPREWYDGGAAVLPRPPEDSLLLPRLIALLAYAQRSMALAAKRLVEMPAFDTLVLSLVADSAPLAQATLVETLRRDQSQAARTIRRLIADGLIVRLPKSSRRAILLSPTQQGLAINHVMAEEVSRRDAFLAHAVPPARMIAYRQTLWQIADNAAAMGTDGTA